MFLEGQAKSIKPDVKASELFKEPWCHLLGKTGGQKSTTMQMMYVKYLTEYKTVVLGKFNKFGDRKKGGIFIKETELRH